MAISVEDWAASYGSPYLVQPDDPGSAAAELVEDDGVFAVHAPRSGPARDLPTAFVDGVRRGEASLYLDDPASGAVARGVAGAHACGAVLVRSGIMDFGETHVRRLVIWGSGQFATLPTTRGVWNWDPRSIADTAPDAPLRELQTRMRQEEGALAERLCADGYRVLVDGPLNFVRSRDLPVVGYVKTHHRALLAPADHARVITLAAGERTSVFRLGADRYSCYMRLAAPALHAGPWSGIVRLEFPQSSGLDPAVGIADEMCRILPRFAGVLHRDPRAPQNLQPIGALERHLRHLLGDAGLASRAVREAVASLQTGGNQ